MPSKHFRHQHTRRHFYGHTKRFQPGPKPPARHATIDTRYQPNAGIRERPDDLLDEVGSNVHVAVRNHQVRIGSRRNHFLQAVHFGIRVSRFSGVHNRNPTAGYFCRSASTTFKTGSLALRAPNISSNLG